MFYYINILQHTIFKITVPAYPWNGLKYLLKSTSCFYKNENKIDWNLKMILLRSKYLESSYVSFINENYIIVISPQEYYNVKN